MQKQITYPIQPLQSVSNWSGKKLRLTPEMLEEYLIALKQRGRTPETVRCYRLYLERLYHFLPPEKSLDQDITVQWIGSLQEAGYADQTINGHIHALNGFLEHIKRRDLRTPTRPLINKSDVPEMTRLEYQQLLKTAREKGDERTFLLVKVFGSMDMTLRDLPYLTKETVQTGFVIVPEQKMQSIPKHLQEELLNYADRNDITSGPIFVTKKGRLMNRSCVSGVIHALCLEANVQADKGNPRCLHMLYRSTRAEIRANVEQLVDQNFNWLLESEQSTVGWVERKE